MTLVHAVNGRPLDGPVQPGLDVAVVGMGCFWGAERLFWRVPGVVVTSVGYAGGHVASPSYREVCGGRTGHAEVVRIVFDPAVLPYERLLAVFWESHDPTQGDRQWNDVGPQYRSGIYAQDPADLEVARTHIAQLTAQGIFAKPIVTEVEPLRCYYPAEAHHQGYFEQHPNQGYCAFVVGPKVAKFEKNFARLLHP